MRHTVGMPAKLAGGGHVRDGRNSPSTDPLLPRGLPAVDKVEKPPPLMPGLPLAVGRPLARFFMKFREPQAHPNRRKRQAKAAAEWPGRVAA